MAITRKRLSKFKIATYLPFDYVETHPSFLEHAPAFHRHLLCSFLHIQLPNFCLVCFETRVKLIRLFRISFYMFNDVFENGATVLENSCE